MSEQQDNIDNWLMKIDKTIKDRSLDDISTSIREYFNNKYKYDVKVIIESDEFNNLKPRHKKLILDQILKAFYRTFTDAFGGCSDDFKREVLMNSTFQQYQGGSKNMNDKNLPIIVKA